MSRTTNPLSQTTSSSTLNPTKHTHSIHTLHTHTRPPPSINTSLNRSPPPVIHPTVMITPSPAPSPEDHPKQRAPSPTTTITASSLLQPQPQPPPPSKSSIDFSPPLIAMVVIIATAFVIITYSRLLSRHFLHLHRRFTLWRHRRRRPSSFSDIDSQSIPYSFDHHSAFHLTLSPYGLDDSVIKTIPLTIYTPTTTRKSYHDCAVCLIEFEHHEYVRTLPICSHTFHVDCIDAWLRSHANCPLCRAGIFPSDSPKFTPLMSSRIRPSLDDVIIETSILEPLNESTFEDDNEDAIREIETNTSNNQSEERFNGRDFLLKRSYSFGFERNLGSERLVFEAVTASPWRYRRGGGGGGFWSSKRPSPFGSLTRNRVFSFRYCRGMKSPFFRRRSGGGGSSRRSKSVASPMFMRSSGSGGVGLFSSSRLRSGDPEALLSPERFNRR